MSLLTESMEQCILIDKTTQADGYGGIKTTWVDGAEFLAAIVLDSSIEARRAEKEGVTSLYTITTRRAVNLPFGQILRRSSDQKLFRVTSDGSDKKTPLSAGLDMRQVTAEHITALPDGAAHPEVTGNG